MADAIECDVETACNDEDTAAVDVAAESSLSLIMRRHHSFCCSALQDNVELSVMLQYNKRY